MIERTLISPPTRLMKYLSMATREVDKHLEEDITGSRQNRSSCTSHTIQAWSLSFSFNYTRVMNTARMTALTSQCAVS